VARTTKSKKDLNQNTLQKQIQWLGHTVHATHMVKDGFPDLVTGYAGLNFLVEIKNPNQSKSGRELTLMEQHFHDSWRGSIMIVETLDQYIHAVNEQLHAYGLHSFKIRVAA